MVNKIDSAKMKTDRKLQRLPLDVQSFRKIVNDDFLYVDKTGLIAKLINSKLTYFFLSRPRRFGKSLLVSTMKEVFSGNKELFKNLEIYHDIDWQTYPVIHFDFSLIAVDESIPVKKALAAEVDKISRDYNLPTTEGNHKSKFRFLIENLSKKENKPVVILIDEYDQFIIRFITDDELREINRSELKDFFSILKGSQEFLRFVFITGVSKFTRVSIFSDLNNLIDLTFDPDYSAIAGYTGEELLKYFPNYILEFAERENYPFDDLVELIRKWYNGYSWDGITKIHNPFSILKLFSSFRFDDYWYCSGTPTFLIDMIRERKTKIHELDNIETTISRIGNMDVGRITLTPLLFQTGYLTIIKKIKKSIDKEEFIIGSPNKDVRISFLTHLLEDFSGDNPRLIDNITNAVKENRPDDVLEDIKSIFAGVPYNNFDPGKEASYHALIHVIFTLLLDNIGAEIQTIGGRLDQVIETDKYVYIFEFKMEDAQKALAQIHEKKYYEKYKIKRKDIVLVGVSFSKEKRNIKEWITENL
jgi:translation initiation factor IF-1